MRKTLRSKALFLAAPMLVLAACAQPVEISQPPVMYTATKPLNERGNTTLSARTYTKTKSGREEIVGVACRFEGDGFASEFSSPAVLIAPELHTKTPPASVTCTYNGAVKTVVLTPFNRTTSEINDRALQLGAGGGVVGVLIGGAFATVQNAKRDAAQDVYAYPLAVVEFD